jgi:Glycogen debranching enzyme
LNALWRASRWQTQLCLQDRFLDSPNHQEPIGDPGDYLIASAQSDLAFGEPWMAAQNLRQFAALLDANGEVTFHASYPLFWVQMLRQYYEHTGDRALVAELAPSVDRLMAHLSTYVGANGLLSEAPNYMFMDWIQVQGYNLHHPPAVIGQGYFSALYYRGLKDAERIAALIGNDANAKDYARQAALLSAAFDRELWDEKVSLYRDGKPFQNHQKRVHYLPADRDIETHTDQVNLFAVLYGLAPEDRAKAIMAQLTRRLPLNVQPYFMHFAFDAEAKTGLWDILAWAQLQQWHLHPQAGTFREMWTAGDWSHSWGGTPLVQLSSRVLGVTPAAPGFARVHIAPHPLNLTWARGAVPTPQGLVSVAWTKDGAGVRLEVASPAGVPIEVDLSALAAGASAVTVDGAARAVGSGGTMQLVPGRHTILVGAGAADERSPPP